MSTRCKLWSRAVSTCFRPSQACTLARSNAHSVVVKAGLDLSGPIMKVINERNCLCGQAVKARQQRCEGQCTTAWSMKHQAQSRGFKQDGLTDNDPISNRQRLKNKERTMDLDDGSRGGCIELTTPRCKQIGRRVPKAGAHPRVLCLPKGY